MSKWFKKYYRSPRTRNEERQNQSEEYSKNHEWCRAKRRPVHLADSWWDRHGCVQRTWKERRKTKYRPGKRGQKHILFIDHYKDVWKLKEYCEEHDIPHDMENVTEPYTYRVPVKEKRVLFTIPRYYTKSHYGKDAFRRTIVTERTQHQIGYEDIVEWVLVGYKDVHTRRTIGYNFTWWSDKDIGIKYILRGR